MYKVDHKSFSIRKTVSAAGMLVKDTLKDKLENHVQEFLGEKAYVEASMIAENKREMKFVVVLPKAQDNPKSMEQVLDGIISLVISEATIEGEAINVENYKKITQQRVNRYKMCV